MMISIPQTGEKGISMDINLLHEFVVLAQSETFLKAADLLFISQPTLSRHIKSMEAELGVCLFERTTRSSKLTKYGHMLLPYAQQTVELYNKFSAELAEEKKEQQSSLRIGSIAAMDVYGITTIITRFKETHPHVKANIVPRHNISFLDMLHNRNCDLVFAREPVGGADENVVHLPLTTDRLVAVVSASHPFAGREALHISELRGQDIITLPESTSVCQIFCTACEREGFLPNLVLTHHSTEHIFNCAKIGMGVAVLADRLITEEMSGEESVRVLEIQPAIRTAINLCYSRDVHLPEAALEFIRLFQAEFQAKEEK